MTTQHDKTNGVASELSGAELVWDETRTIQRLGGQRALIEKLVILFLRDAPEQMEQALNGIEQQNYDNSHIAMHSLKGTSANFCTVRFESICAELLDALKHRDWPQATIIHGELSIEYLSLEREFKKIFGH